uniref:Uncharacterized protein n=1 Tax=Anguilla anguilla TaxID=7936 RepID=A0A0E9VG17_ANGAN
MCVCVCVCVCVLACSEPFSPHMNGICLVMVQLLVL